MPRLPLQIQNISRDGLNPTFSAAVTDGHSFDNTSQQVVLYVDNGNASNVDVTILVTATVDGLSVSNRTVTVPSGGLRIIGPFPKTVYSGLCTDTGLTQAVKVNYSATSSVNVAAVRMPPPDY